MSKNEDPTPRKGTVGPKRDTSHKAKGRADKEEEGKVKKTDDNKLIQRDTNIFYRMIN